MWTPWECDETGCNESEAEDAWWSENAWFWFEDWGEFRINTEINGIYSSQKIKKGENVSVSGFNFNIWDY